MLDWRGVLKVPPKPAPSNSYNQQGSSNSYGPRGARVGGSQSQSSSYQQHRQPSSYREPIPNRPPLPTSNGIASSQASLNQNHTTNPLSILERMTTPIEPIASTSKFLPSISWATNWFSPAKVKAPSAPAVTTLMNSHASLPLKPNFNLSHASLPLKPNFVLGLDVYGRSSKNSNSTDVFDVSPPALTSGKSNDKGKGKARSSLPSSSPRSIRKRKLSALDIEVIEISSGSSDLELDQLQDDDIEQETLEESTELSSLSITSTTANFEQLAHEARKKQRKEARKLAKMIAKSDSEKAMSLDERLANESMDSAGETSMTLTGSSSDLVALIQEEIVSVDTVAGRSVSKDIALLSVIDGEVSREMTTNSDVESPSLHQSTPVARSPNRSLNQLLSPAPDLLPWETESLVVMSALTVPTSLLFPAQSNALASSTPNKFQSSILASTSSLPNFPRPSSSNSISACISSSMTSIIAPSPHQHLNRRSSLPARVSLTPNHPPPPRRAKLEKEVLKRSLVADAESSGDLNIAVSNTASSVPVENTSKELEAPVGYFFDTPSKVTSRKVSIGWLGATGTNFTVTTSTSLDNTTSTYEMLKTLNRELEVSDQELALEKVETVVVAKEVTEDQVKLVQKQSKILQQRQDTIIIDDSSDVEEDSVISHHSSSSSSSAIFSPLSLIQLSSTPVKKQSIALTSRYSALQHFSDDMDMDISPPTSPSLMTYEDFQGERKAYEDELEERESKAIAESLLAYC